MDSISPYTVWSDELSALRGNLNCFFNLAAEMAAALITGVIAYGIFLLSGSAVITVVSVTSVLLVVCVACILIGMPFVKKNIESLT